MKSMGREIELKLLLDAEGETALQNALAGLTWQVERKPVQSLRGVYYDTPDRALAARRIALRLRKEGRRWVQTAKMGGAISAGLSTPHEAECPAPGGRLSVDAIPDPELRAAVEQAMAGAALEPVCETAIRRERSLIHGPFGGVVELASDAGEIRAGDRAEPIREAELELKSGDPRDIYAVAKALFPAGPIRFSRRTKAERGYALADGRPAVDPAPPAVTARDARLAPTQTTEAAAAAVLRSCLDQIAGNVAAAHASDAPEGPHQLRVGLRRLRTAAAVFRPVLGGPALDALDAAAKALAGEVGAVRDLDVLAGEVIAPMAQGEPRFAPLVEALERRAAEARARVRERLAAPETVALILDLGAFVEARGWLRAADFDQTALLAQPVVATATDALQQRWRKAAKLGDRIETLVGEERHDLRKKLKKVRYTVEFFSSLWPEKKVKPFLSTLKALQDDFGALQDFAMAEAVLCGPDAPAADDPLAQRAVGYALGRWEGQAEREWARAKSDWRALSEAKRFWS